jgi:hypothetical protein
MLLLLLGRPLKKDNMTVYYRPKIRTNDTQVLMLIQCIIDSLAGFSLAVTKYCNPVLNCFCYNCVNASTEEKNCVINDVMVFKAASNTCLLQKVNSALQIVLFINVGNSPW